MTTKISQSRLGPGATEVLVSQSLHAETCPLSLTQTAQSQGSAAVEAVEVLPLADAPPAQASEAAETDAGFDLSGCHL